MGMLEQTAAQYRSLRMTSIAAELAQLLAEAEASEMSFLSFAQRLAEYELQQRQANRVQRNYKTAGFPAHKHLEGFDYRHQTTISKRQINSLLDFRFIDERNNVIFIGPPGVGKTHGHRDWYKAVEAGYRVLFRTALELVEELELAEMKGELKRKSAS